MSVTLPVRLRTLEAEVARLHGRPRPLTADERRILAVGGGDIVDTIRQYWPRDTGFSAAQWSYTIGGHTGDYHITLENAADYVQHVHTKGDPTPLWSTLIPRIVRAIVPVIQADVLAEAAITEERLQREAARRRQPREMTFLDLLRNRQGVARGA